MQANNLIIIQLIWQGLLTPVWQGYVNTYVGSLFLMQWPHLKLLWIYLFKLNV